MFTVVLCNLISCRLVVIKIMLSVESADRLDIAVQRNRGAEGR